MKVVCVVGARPNLVKVAPLIDAWRPSAGVTQTLVHTGQHYDERLSQIFFDELAIPAPDIYLGVGSSSQAVQTARIMVELEQVLPTLEPDVVVVFGDVNSTLACAVTCAKLQLPVAHVEAGLRSFDRTMPEEVNRIVTDVLSDTLFTTERTANENLAAEGIDDGRIFFVGNIMIDSLFKHKARAAQLGTPARLGLQPHKFALMTLHRPANVDSADSLQRMLAVAGELQDEIPVVFPIHPRTRGRLEEFGLLDRLTRMDNLAPIAPLGYLEFLDLMMHARLVLTDSGGIQEETTALGVPCLTLRDNTERPVTVNEGTNLLVSRDPARIMRVARGALAEPPAETPLPELWDGHTAERIAGILNDRYG